MSGSSTSAVRQTLRHHHQRHVAHHLGGRRHLDDVAEQIVGGAIGLGDFVPARFQAQRARLFLEIGELPARHFMQIDFRGARLEVAFEGGILGAHRFPIEADLADGLGIEPGIARRVAQRLDDRAEAGLRGGARHRVHRGIDRVDAGIDRRQHGGAGDARGVMGVEMDRQADLAPSAPRPARAPAAGLSSPAMSLIARIWQPASSSSFAIVDVIGEVIFGAGGIEQIAGVADRAFRQLARFAAPRRWRRAYSRPS